MVVYSAEINISTKGETDIIDITDDINDIIKKSKINNGIICIFVPGSTGSITTIEYEPGLKKDFPKEFRNERDYRRDNPFTSIAHFSTDSKKYKKNKLFVIGFCGKLYLGWKFIYEIKEFDPELGYQRDVEKEDIIFGYENAKDHLKDTYWTKKLEDHIKYVVEYDPINIFREINAPIFVFDSGIDFRHNYINSQDSQFIINPNLKKYEFYKVVDAFTAFQEIQMFISGVLGIGEREIIEVEDKYKIDQHGYDKWSFRKESGKKERR